MAQTSLFEVCDAPKGQVKERPGATPGPDAVADRIYLPLGRRAVPVGPLWQPVAAASSTEVLMRRLNQQEPGKDMTGQAVVTKRAVGKGAIVAVYGPVFRNYYVGHSPALREWIGSLLDGLEIGWMAEVKAPPHLEVILRQKNGKLLVNLLNRGAGETLSPSRVIVEELPLIEHVVVRLRRDGPPKSVTMVPPDVHIDWSYREGWVTVNVARVDIHRVVVVE